MFFLKKKGFDKFKNRYDKITIAFVRPDLKYIPDNENFYIKINNEPFEYYGNSDGIPDYIATSYSLKTSTNGNLFIDRPLKFKKLVDILQNAESHVGKGFKAVLSLRKAGSLEEAGRIHFEIINDDGYIRLNSIKYKDASGQETDYIQNTENKKPVIFFKKNVDVYTGEDIANILITEDYFDETETKVAKLQLVIANLDLVPDKTK